jgi:hypothetical protein
LGAKPGKRKRRKKPSNHRLIARGRLGSSLPF